MTADEMRRAINCPKKHLKTCEEFLKVGAEYAALRTIIDSQRDGRANDAQYGKQCELETELNRLIKSIGPDYHLCKYSGGAKIEAPKAYDDTWVLSW